MSNKYMPPSDGACIKCKMKKAVATPYLCFTCFDQISYQLTTFFSPHDDENIFAVKLKKFKNKAQKYTRKNYKRNK